MSESRFEQPSQLIAAHNYHGALESLGAMDLAGLSDEDRGRALAVEAVAKDRLSQQEGFLQAYLSDVLEQVKGGWLFRSGLAQQLMVVHEYGAAEGLLRDLVVQLPADAGMRCDLALAVEQQGRLEEAEALYAETVTRQPGYAEAHRGRARCLQAMGKAEEAAGAWRGYTGLKPDDGAGWLALGIAETDGGRYEAAEEAFERAGALEPDSPALLFNRAIASMRQGDERSAGFVERLAEVAPTDWRSEAAAALLAESVAEGDRALTAMERAFDLALVEADADLQEAGLVQVFSFFQRHGLRTKADELELILHSHGVLPEGVLAVLREIRGRWSEKAVDFFVLVGGRAPLHAAVATGDNRRTGEEWRSFLRAYRVFAESVKSAEGEALDAESRTAVRDLHVVETGENGVAGGQFLGIRFRSGRMFYSEEES